MPTALITGASRGLGLALASALAVRRWDLIVDARDGRRLSAAVDALSHHSRIDAIPGDVTDPGHRSGLAGAVARRGSLDLLVNNASALGPSPLEPLTQVKIEEFESVLATNVVAPLAIIQVVAEHLSPGAVVINVTSDASVEAYEGWGVYGAGKAALDQLSAILAIERPDLAVYSFDPGDMRTRMHQDAFPGEDISDRPEPESVVPAILSLLHSRPPSGRVTAAELLATP